MKVLFSKRIFNFLPIICLATLFVACNSTQNLIADLNEELTDASISPKEIATKIPNYTGHLKSVKGKTRAVISEPGNSDRVTIDFEANEAQNVLTIKNRVGIEGGKIWVDQDSLLIYDKTNKLAQKIAIKDDNSSIINDFATINILDLLNFKVAANQINTVKQSSKEYVLFLKSGTTIRMDKATFLIKKVTEAPSSTMPYSEIEYDGYSNLDDYTFPRKIVIFSRDKKAKIALQILNLTANPNKLNFNIDIPANIAIDRL